MGGSRVRVRVRKRVSELRQDEEAHPWPLSRVLAVGFGSALGFAVAAMFVFSLIWPSQTPDTRVAILVSHAYWFIIGLSVSAWFLKRRGII